MASELKPCICGKTPRLDIKKGLAGITKVPFYREQIMCRCGVSSKIFKAPRKAVEAWNTRHGTLTNEGTTIPTPVAPVSPDATGKCEELKTIGFVPPMFAEGKGANYNDVFRSVSIAENYTAVVTRSQAVELLAAKEKELTSMWTKHGGYERALAKGRERIEALEAKLALAETSMLEMHQDLNKLEADNAALTARVKETEDKLAAATDLVSRAQEIIPVYQYTWHDFARAALGGKPS